MSAGAAGFGIRSGEGKNVSLRSSWLHSRPTRIRLDEVMTVVEPALVVPSDVQEQRGECEYSAFLRMLCGWRNIRKDPAPKKEIASSRRLLALTYVQSSHFFFNSLSRFRRNGVLVIV